MFLLQTLRVRFLSKTTRSLKSLLLKVVIEALISYVTMFFQHIKQCDEANQIIFQTCCKNPDLGSWS